MASTTPTPQVRVGVGVFVLSSSSSSTPQNPRFLLGKRLNSHGANTYALPGGHLEYSESPESCAAREVHEETDLVVDRESIRFLTATNDFMPAEGRHYITLFMVCKRVCDSDEPLNVEADKCAGWECVSWEELKGWAQGQVAGEGRDGGGMGRRLFQPLLSLLEQRPGVVPTLV